MAKKPDYDRTVELSMTRRQALAALGTAAVAHAADPPVADAALLKAHDEQVKRSLAQQNTDTKSRWYGGLPDDAGLHLTGNAAGFLSAAAAAFLHPGSTLHHNPLLVERMRLAAAYLDRLQTPEGNVAYLTTNFNSPPDTAFVVNPVATAACLARRYGAPELVAMLEPFLRKAGAGMARGGVHTPNHRWVICSALAQIHELFPDSAYPRRIGQWLAEGIDIDEEGQYTERSTGSYNPIVDRSLVIMAAKLNRPELLDPVRRNLDSMLWLLHPGYEVVTEISRRQDQYRRDHMGLYWFPLRYLAVRDGNGRYATLASHFQARSASLATMMEYPELARPLPQLAAIPEDYEKSFPGLGVARIRRGSRSATLVLGNSSRFVTFRRGDAIVNAVRFASAFFGKGQFTPTVAEKRGESYYFSQELTAGYMQPLDPARKVGPDGWVASGRERRQTEICRLTQSAVVTETPRGLRIRMQAHGTKDIPLSVEISLAPGGTIEGCERARQGSDAWLLRGGHATLRSGADSIRIGPGLGEHTYTQVRGAEPRIEGQSIYLCGYTPFDHTIEIG
jgi:hypothetical protein